MADRAEPAREAPTAATFQPVRVHRTSDARTRLVTVAWALALIGVAGLAIVGRLTAPGEPIDTRVAIALAATATTAMTSAAVPDRTNAPDPVRAQPIVLTSPADGDPTITAVELIVQGFVQVDTASLRVILEAGGLRVDETTVRPALAFGERPSSTRHAQFFVRFGLPDPRPNGPMVVRLVALDRDGQRLAALLRPFQLGPIERPTLGDDGLLGGLVFATS